YKDDVGFFGFFECIDDKDVAHALFKQAEEWLSDQGLRTVRGPMNFTINDECGLLIDAFDLPPVLLMTYNPPYYQELVESYGFEKSQDLYAYRIT
ncbi:MAG: N-acetyltransferase, partial [Candidatus Marinimicrobia bacterium]|nr:N-acetyltransferase [Candidatus Neomarinimicrobiota bacterium]